MRRWRWSFSTPKSTTVDSGVRDNGFRHDDAFVILRHDSIARLDDEVKELLADGKKEGEADKENILKQTDEFVEKISKQAKLISEQEVNLAKKALREETAELAVELATKILKKVMEQKDHDKLIEDYSSKLEEIH